MQHERRTHQIHQLETPPRIALIQRREVRARNPIPILGDETFRERRPKVVATPTTDAQLFTDLHESRVVKKGVAAENSIFKENGARIDLPEAAAPPMKM
jgi:hypothetical protein